MCPRTLAPLAPANTNRIHCTAEMAPKKKSGANAKAARAERHSMVDAPTDVPAAMDQDLPPSHTEDLPVVMAVVPPPNEDVPVVPPSHVAAVEQHVPVELATSAALPAATSVHPRPVGAPPRGVGGQAKVWDTVHGGWHDLSAPPADAATAATAVPTAIPKPRGRAPKVGPDDATWDVRDGCWRAPDGSVHLTQAEAAAARRALCADIDRAARGEPPLARHLVTRTFTLTVPDSFWSPGMRGRGKDGGNLGIPRLLEGPREPGGATIGGDTARDWYATVRATFDKAIGGCEMQPTHWTPSGVVHVLRPSGAYWPTVDERLACEQLTRAQFEACLRTEWHAAMLEAETLLRAEKEKILAQDAVRRREAAEARAAAASERAAKLEALHPGIHARRQQAVQMLLARNDGVVRPRHAFAEAGSVDSAAPPAAAPPATATAGEGSSDAMEVEVVVQVDMERMEL